VGSFAAADEPALFPAGTIVEIVFINTASG
jgi:hypothetical protein